MAHLDQANWQERVALLRHIAATGGEVGTLPQYKEMLASPYAAERYWLARALGESRRPETFDDLLRLLHDPQPNVVCMAFYGLGRRGEQRAVKDIIARLRSSDKWYEQWYGYRALRSLGWRQKGSSR
jgi:HEAT repeat protein